MLGRDFFKYGLEGRRWAWGVLKGRVFFEEPEALRKRQSSLLRLQASTAQAAGGSRGGGIYKASFTSMLVGELQT